MFFVLERGDHHRRVVEVRRRDEHGVKVADAVVENLAVILRRPRLWEFLLHFVQLALVHVGEASPLDLRMALQGPAVRAAHAADADLIEAEFAVQVGLRAGQRRERGDGGGEHRAVAEESAAGDGSRGGGGRNRFYVRCPHDEQETHRLKQTLAQSRPTGA